MDDIKLAMLGSKEAAKRLTDAGVLLPCRCGAKGEIITMAKYVEVPSLMERLGIKIKEARP